MGNFSVMDVTSSQKLIYKIIIKNVFITIIYHVFITIYFTKPMMIEFRHDKYQFMHKFSILKKEEFMCYACEKAHTFLRENSL